MISGGCCKNFWKGVICKKKTNSFITYLLMLSSKGKIEEISKLSKQTSDELKQDKRMNRLEEFRLQEELLFRQHNSTVLRRQSSKVKQPSSAAKKYQVSYSPSI